MTEETTKTEITLDEVVAYINAFGLGSEVIGLNTATNLKGINEVKVTFRGILKVETTCASKVEPILTALYRRTAAIHLGCASSLKLGETPAETMTRHIRKVMAKPELYTRIPSIDVIAVFLASNMGLYSVKSVDIVRADPAERVSWDELKLVFQSGLECDAVGAKPVDVIGGRLDMLMRLFGHQTHLGAVPPGTGRDAIIPIMAHEINSFEPVKVASVDDFVSKHMGSPLSPERKATKGEIRSLLETMQAACEAIQKENAKDVAYFVEKAEAAKRVAKAEAESPTKHLGRVTREDITVNGLPNLASVRAWIEDGKYGTTKIDEDGSFEMVLANGGKYTVGVTAETELTPRAMSDLLGALLPAGMIEPDYVRVILNWAVETNMGGGPVDPTARLTKHPVLPDEDFEIPARGDVEPPSPEEQAKDVEYFMGKLKDALGGAKVKSPPHIADSIVSVKVQPLPTATQINDYIHAKLGHVYVYCSVTDDLKDLYVEKRDEGASQHRRSPSYMVEHLCGDYGTLSSYEGSRRVNEFTANEAAKRVGKAEADTARQASLEARIKTFVNFTLNGMDRRENTPKLLLTGTLETSAPGPLDRELKALAKAINAALEGHPRWQAVSGIIRTSPRSSMTWEYDVCPARGISAVGTFEG